MLSFKTVSILALTGLVLGQSPEGTSPKVTNGLRIAYGQNEISPSGENIPRDEVAQAPTIAQPSGTTPGGKSILFMIDLDVPRNGTRTNLLHWFAYDVDANTNPVSVPTTNGAPYLQPSPPEGDLPHRYVFYLFDQPQNFQVPSSFKSINPPSSNNARVGFSLTAFAAQSGLRAPIAASYIQVQRGTPAATNTFPPLQSSTNAAFSNGSVTMSTPSASGPTGTSSGSPAAGNGTNSASSLSGLGWSAFAALAVALV